MGMSVGSEGGDDEVMSEMNTTPLIDVMLVLLIMLIITIPVQLHSVTLNMPPPSTTTPPNPPVIIEINVDFDGTILWGTEVIPDAATLDAKFRGVASKPLADQPEIHLRPNKLVPYKNVAQVMAAAQRLGITKIGLIGSEQFI